MTHRSTMLKVLSPVEGKNGKTYWLRIGSAFVNRDGSTNVYLNAYPTSGKLQIRELDERDQQPGYRGSGAQSDDHEGQDFNQDDLPF